MYKMSKNSYRVDESTLKMVFVRAKWQEKEEGKQQSRGANALWMYKVDSPPLSHNVPGEFLPSIMAKENATTWSICAVLIIK